MLCRLSPFLLSYVACRNFPLTGARDWLPLIFTKHRTFLVLVLELSKRKLILRMLTKQRERALIIFKVNLLGKVLPSLVECGHTGSQVEDCQHTAPVSVSPGYHTMLKRKSQLFCLPAELNIVSLRAEEEGFHPANINITPGHFHRKQKENRTTRTSKLFDSSPSNCIW